MAKHDVLLLDACSLINIYASRHMGPILATRREQCAVARNVLSEARTVRRGGDGPDSRGRESIDWSGATLRDVFHIIDAPTEDESLMYFDLSLELGDGEAMTGAIALHRGYGVVTDDDKARRILGERGISITPSLELVADWAIQNDVPTDILQAVVNDIRVRARYQPARKHPWYTWWITALSADE